MIGETLRLLRIFYGFKSKEIANKLEISQSYVSEIENSKKQPSLELLNKYAEVFEMKTSTIILLSESLEDEFKKNLDKKHKTALIGMRILKVLEKVGKLEDE